MTSNDKQTFELGKFIEDESRSLKIIAIEFLINLISKF